MSTLGPRDKLAPGSIAGGVVFRVFMLVPAIVPR